MTKIFCWNVAGLRSSIKKGALDCLKGGEYDIVCLQETKTLPEEVFIPTWINELYPNRYWQSKYGKGEQKKGFSGTSIWSKKVGKQLNPPENELEGRITSVEFEEFILVTVYTVNSQGATSKRLEYRTEVWDLMLRSYIKQLKEIKPVIICGDLNVSHLDVDIYEPIKYKNKIPCFFDSERNNMQELINEGFVDAFRYKYGNKENCYTYWNQRAPQMRITNRGFRIDYFLVDEKIKSNIIDTHIQKDIMGSDHCPITLELYCREVFKELEIKEKQEVRKKTIRKIKLKIVNKEEQE